MRYQTSQISVFIYFFLCAFLPLLCYRPQNNGKFCPGSSRLNQLCNTRPCPIPSVDFRAQQCAEYNSKPFRGWYYKWKPYTKVDGKIGQSWPKVFVLYIFLCAFISEYIMDYWFRDNIDWCGLDSPSCSHLLTMPRLPPHYGSMEVPVFCKWWWPICRTLQPTCWESPKKCLFTNIFGYV